ncbi:Kelch-like protein 5 [Hordeum vulgare]|nr:Kelch-like protein 5 [Hordeum vulgare]
MGGIRLSQLNEQHYQISAKCQQMTQDLSQALVLSDNQFPPSFVQDSQPMSEMAPDSEVFASDFVYVPVVLVQQTPATAAATAKAKKDDFHATPDVEVIDGPDKHFEKPFDKPFDPVHDRKRKRGDLMEEEINVFCSMTEAVKEVATAIRECKPLDVHPDLYGVVMTQGGFSDKALMAALSHLLDNKAQGVGFVAMADAHRGKWYAVFIGKAPGVYSSWEEAGAQVASYSNNSHRGFKTRQAAEQAYSDWVQKHGGSSVDSGKIGGVKVEGEGATVDCQLGLKLKNFIIFAQSIANVVLWRWCARCAHCG